MVQFKKEGTTPLIVYKIKGDKADYIAQKRALIIALGTIEDEDAKQTLAAMLLDMLPDVKQLNHIAVAV